ncbi:hypothetical protein GCM10009835_18510 [Planosporangium flavigriseum]|uniref:Uncharacterized protein n=1 Tax=Planosporangium flavigriseum TaxID=373681 RepID=A0A8J3LR51_9ACTN|nr:hypothetical protein Pfl04_35220 [Planosporangium flavigriseum]
MSVTHTCDACAQWCHGCAEWLGRWWVCSASADVIAVYRSDSSFDALAGSLNNMFNFRSPNDQQILLDPNTGAVVHGDRNNN